MQTEFIENMKEAVEVTRVQLVVDLSGNKSGMGFFSDLAACFVLSRTVDAASSGLRAFIDHWERLWNPTNT